MPEYKNVSLDQTPAQQSMDPKESALVRKLISYGDQTYQEYSRYRFAEEREWL